VNNSFQAKKERKNGGMRTVLEKEVFCEKESLPISSGDLPELLIGQEDFFPGNYWLWKMDSCYVCCSIVLSIAECFTME